MPRLLLTIFVFAIAIISKGQVIENRVTKQIDSLRLLKVDTFLIYSFTCNTGGLPSDPFDTCSYEETQYLFWMQNSKTFLKRFDYCKNYEAVELDTTNPIMFYLINRRAIDNEEIKAATYYEIRRTKKGIDTLIGTSMVDHSYYHNFNFWIKDRSIRKTVDIYNLSFEKFENGKRSIYYNYNQRTKLKGVIDIISVLLKQ